MNSKMAQAILEEMRKNLKAFILPELSEPFALNQAVSIYVLLKAISAFISPNFKKIWLEINKHLEAVLSEIDKLFCRPEYQKIFERDGLCLQIRDLLQSDVYSQDPVSHNLEMNEILCKAIQVMHGEIKVESKTYSELLARIRGSLRRQLDMEMSLFT